MTRTRFFTSLFLSTGLISATFATQAKAQDTGTRQSGIRPYVGLEYQFISASLDDLAPDFSFDNIYADSYSSVVPHIGIRTGRHFGLEVGYTKSFSEETSFSGSVAGISGTSNLETEASGWTIDAIGYLPIDQNDELEVIGEVGVGFYELDASGTATLSGIGTVDLTDSEDSTALRLGIGGQLALNSNISARGMVRYIAMDSDVVEDAITFSIGLGYNF